MRTVYEQPSAGISPNQTRSDDALRRMLERVIPEWARGSKLLNNGGEHYTTSSNAEIKIAHGLGRRHRGWFIVSPKYLSGSSSNGARDVFEDASDTAAIRDTHLQLQCAAGTRFEYTFDVVIF